MTIFRPCIDLHQGKVKQIVGGTLIDKDPLAVITNFESTNSVSYYVNLYKEHGLEGTHVIRLGEGNEAATAEALQAWPDGLMVGGGITGENALAFIQKGAQKIIITSWLFPDGRFSEERAELIANLVGRERCVFDLSCRRIEGGDEASWVIVMNRWQTRTNLMISKETLEYLSQYCCEYLIHAADVEGLCQGIDEELVQKLGEWTPIPCTYAGGAKSMQDFEVVDRLSNGKIDLTVGSSLDIFGGNLIRFADCVEWNRRHLLLHHHPQEQANIFE